MRARPLAAFALAAMLLAAATPPAGATEYTTTPASPAKTITTGTQSGSYAASGVDANDGTMDTTTASATAGATTNGLTTADETFQSSVGAWTQTQSQTGTAASFTAIRRHPAETATADGSGSGYLSAQDAFTVLNYGTVTQTFIHDFTVPAGWTTAWTQTAKFSWKHVVTSPGSNRLNSVTFRIAQTSGTIVQTLHSDTNGGAGWTGAASSVATWQTVTGIGVATTGLAAGTTYRLTVEFVDIDIVNADTPTIDAFVDDVQIAFTAPTTYAADVVYKFPVAGARDRASWEKVDIYDSAAAPTAATAYVRNFATSTWESLGWAYSASEVAHGAPTLPGAPAAYGSSDAVPEVWIRYAWSGASASTPLTVDLVTVTVTGTIWTVAADPVAASGSAQVGQPWGGWSASPGATNVESQNFLKITNDGLVPAQVVTVDFTPTVFTGATDATFTVPIDGNVRFAWWEDATGTAAPSAGTYTYGSLSANGAVTVTFGGLGRVIFVKYRIETIPAAHQDQTYTAALTVT